MAIFNGTVNDDYIVGSDENDEIYGSNGVNNLRGGLGDDLIEGGLNEDYLLGQDGADTIRGFAGNDNIFGGLGNDTLEGGDGNDWIDGGEGDDLLIAGAGYDRMYGGAGNDSFRVTPEYTAMWGGEGIDTLLYDNETDFVSVVLTDTVGYSHVYSQPYYWISPSSIGGARIEGIENVVGSEGNDYLVGNSLANELTGNGGMDNIRGGAGDDIIHGGAGADYLLGQAGNDTINGGSENDNLYGGDGDDTLNGGDGNDWLIGGAGADTIDGGSGINTIAYENSDAGVNIDIETGICSGGYAEGETVANIQQVIGSSFDDVLLGNFQNNYFRGNAGADTINGIGGVNIASYEGSDAGININLITGIGTGGHAEGDLLSNIQKIIATDFDDVLVGNEEDNFFRVGDGINSIDGQGGYNIVSYEGSAAINVNLATGTASGGYAQGDSLTNIHGVVGGDGHDTFYGQDGVDNYFYGGRGNDIFHSSTGANTYEGGATYNTVNYANSTAGVYVNLNTGVVYGGHADDDIFIGIEQIYGSDYDDTIYTLSTGWSQSRGGGGNDYIRGGSGQNNLNGGDGNDTLYGVAGSNNLFGDTGDDKIYGGSGNDFIRGGEGQDILSGGYGADTFAFYYYDDSNYSYGVDTITDFSQSQNDVLRFSFGSSWTNFSIYHSGGDTILTHGTFRLVLDGTHDLTEADFSFI